MVAGPSTSIPESPSLSPALSSPLLYRLVRFHTSMYKHSSRTVKSASYILLQGVPSHVSLDDVRDSIQAVDGVVSVHELHVWQLSESTVVASVHVLISQVSS